MMFRSTIRPLLVALSLAFAATAAAPAFADSADATAAEHKEHKEGHKERAKGRAAHFPMAGDKFDKMVDSRLTKAKEKLTAKLDERKVAADQKAKILKGFDDSAALVRAAAKRAAKDGEVTKDEAKEIRGMVKTLRQELHAKLAPKKADKKAKDV